jgi:hypothetical protein
MDSWTCNHLLRWSYTSLLRCVHKATLAQTYKTYVYGIYGSNGPILPLSMVASLRHQSIINMNKIKIHLLHEKILQHHETIFSRLFLKLMGYELNNTISQIHKLLIRQRGAPGAWSFSEMLFAPFLPCVHAIHEIPLPKPFTTRPSLAWFIFHLHCFTSCHILFPFLLCFHQFLRNKALAFPCACHFHVPKMPNGGHVMHRETHYVNQARKPP